MGNRRSIEIKQTAFRIDGVFLPPENSPDKTVYFCEVQFQKDKFLYHRLFAELFLFLDQNPSTDDWYAVIIYPKRSLEPDETRLYEVLLESSKVQRVYLDELESTADQSLAIGIVKLVVEPEENATHRARQLIQQTRQEVANSLSSKRDNRFNRDDYSVQISPVEPSRGRKYAEIQRTQTD